MLAIITVFLAALSRAHSDHSTLCAGDARPSKLSSRSIDSKYFSITIPARNVGDDDYRFRVFAAWPRSSTAEFLPSVVTLGPIFPRANKTSDNFISDAANEFQAKKLAQGGFLGIAVPYFQENGLLPGEDASDVTVISVCASKEGYSADCDVSLESAAAGYLGLDDNPYALVFKLAEAAHDEVKQVVERGVEPYFHVLGTGFGGEVALGFSVFPHSAPVSVVSVLPGNFPVASGGGFGPPRPILAFYNDRTVPSKIFAFEKALEYEANPTLFTYASSNWRGVDINSFTYGLEGECQTPAGRLAESQILSFFIAESREGHESWETEYIPEAVVETPKSVAPKSVLYALGGIIIALAILGWCYFKVGHKSDDETEEV